MVRTDVVSAIADYARRSGARAARVCEIQVTIGGLLPPSWHDAGFQSPSTLSQLLEREHRNANMSTPFEHPLTQSDLKVYNERKIKQLEENINKEFADRAGTILASCLTTSTMLDIYDYHFYSSLKIDLEFYRFTAAHPDR